MRHQLTLEAILLAIIGGTVGIVVALQASKSPQQIFVTTLNPPKVIDHVPTPTVITPEPKKQETVTSQISSDGKKMVRLKGIQNSDGSTDYTISVTDGEGNSEQVLFREAAAAGERITIPFNTWSPDDKYFFIQEQTGTGKKVLVFKASGEAFSDQQFYLNATDIFANRKTGYTFDEATGWASNSLLLINTVADDDTKGPSYWFEVPSRAVIRLSTEF